MKPFALAGLSCLLMAFNTTLLLAQDTGSAEPAAAVIIATARDGQSVPVQALDDPASPYLGQYGPWEHWVYANYQPGFDPAAYGGG